MKEQFVTYEIALKLKELGFDEECLCTYGIENKSFQRNPSNNMAGEEIEEPYTWKNSLIHQSVMTAPLWQQTIDFFREKFGINICINCVNWRQGNQFEGSLSKVTTQEMLDNNDFSKYIHLTDLYATYEEAREQAILKAIELCQKEK